MKYLSFGSTKTGFPVKYYYNCKGLTRAFDPATITTTTTTTTTEEPRTTTDSDYSDY